jgi:uncharacterized delta-60 repeat protein
MKKKYFQSLLIILTANFSAKAQQTYLDTTFGTNGIVTTEKFEPASICIQQDGKIVIVGSTETGGIGWDCVIYRFNTDGSPDNNFGTDGKYHIIQNHHNRAVGIVQIPTGQLVVLATNKYQISDYATFIKLNSNGSLDTSYGEGGIQTIMTSTIPYQMVLAADEKILVAGQHRRLTSTPPFNSWFTRPRIQRYSPDLVLDTSFSIPSYSWNMMAGATNIGIDADGKIVSVYHYQFQVSDPAYKLAKFLPNGEPDLNFGVNGIKDVEINAGENNISCFNIMADGKFLLSGAKTGETQSAFLMRIDADGLTDSDFAESGILTLSNSSGHDETSVTSVKLTNGKVLNALQKWEADNYDFGLLLTNYDGSPDTAFADTGVETTSLPGNQMLQCMVQQPDGRIVAAGFDEDKMILVRYDISGVLKSDSFSQPLIKVFPNPSTDSVTVTNLPDGTPIAIYSIFGQKLREIVSEGETVIDTGYLNAGIYIIQTPNDKVKLIKK